MLGKFCPELPFDLEELFWLGMDRIEWKFKIGTNVIMSVVERNLALVTQLVRVP
jgi:hypothetical protein